MSTGDRAESMAARLTHTFLRAGLADRDVAQIDTAYRSALARRQLYLSDVDPTLLHPARTMLILFHDAGVASSVVLSAAAFVDSYREELMVTASEVADGLGEQVSNLVLSVPSPQRAGDELLEQLIGAGHETRLVALAERLDHARHLHMLTGTDHVVEQQLVDEVYLPVAMRTDATLARRFSWWLEAFSRGHRSG